MIILDTNIISELFRLKPAPQVLDWLDAQPVQELATTSITVAELRFGAHALPAGKRRDKLNAAITQMLEKPLMGRVIDFDLRAAELYGLLAADLRRNGMTIGQSDMMIAAITLAQEATLATRNIRDFLPSKVRAVNPFEVA